MDGPASRPDNAARSADASRAQPSTVAADVAKRIFERETLGGLSGDALGAAAERTFARILAGLSRWFGAYGSAVLVTRALARAQAEHPSLAGVVVAATEPPSVTGLVACAEVHGDKELTDGVVGMLAALADLIGRLIGDDLVIRLLDQSTQTPGPNGTGAASESSADPARSGARVPADVPQTMKDHE